MAKTQRDLTFQRWKAMDKEREGYFADWRDLSDFVLGHRGRFIPQEADRSKTYQRRRNERLYNETAKMAANILMSGMMAGITSPARPWFKLQAPDPDMDEFEPVKLWLADVERVLLKIFAQSNFYNAMNSIYLELGTFGTTAMNVKEDYWDVCRFEPYTIGSFALDIDDKRRVDTLYRRYWLTVRAAVERFGGAQKFSRAVQNMWDKGEYMEKVEILTAIEPNPKHNRMSGLSRDRAWREISFECGGKGGPLYEGGYHEQPFMAPRWSSVAEDIYSTSYPGIDSLASNKSLQVEELDKAIAQEKMHNPPLVGDAALAQANVDLIAGGITYAPFMSATGKPGLAPIYEVNPDINALRESILAKEDRINRFFFADLFLMVTEMDRAQITATEIAERKEEKMLMLGPVLEHLNNELLDPVIDRTFYIADRAGLIPPAPEEIAGADLRVEYISVLAQAQKAVSTASIESTVAFAGNMAAIWPEARHKVDAMQAIDEYAKAKGATPKIIKSDEEAQQAAQQEQQAMAMAQAAQAAPGVASAVRDVAETEVPEDGGVAGQLQAALQEVA